MDPAWVATIERRYDLDGRSLHWEPGVLPDPTEWRDLEALLEAHPARWIFFEGAPHPKAEERLRALGVATVVFEPGGNRPASGDWLGVMNENAARVEAAGF